MFLASGSSLPRKPVIFALVAVFSLILISISHTHESLPDVPFLPKWERPLPVLQAGRTIIYESAVHDEVTGALGHSLSLSNVSATYASRFRFQFDEVLKDMLPIEPDILPEHQKNVARIKEWLKNDEIDNLILTTCSDGVKIFHDELLDSTVNIICVVHHGGGMFYNHLKNSLKTLVQRGQITLLVLGHHVRDSVFKDLQLWADNEDAEYWEKTKLETFIPGFVYPRDKQFKEVKPFPRKAVIQGNIEPGRRNYNKIFTGLNASMHADPALWGYKMDEATNTFVPAVDEPFELHLVGQKNPKNPVEPPEAIKNVVFVDEHLPYPDYYKLIGDADLLIPAFAIPGTLIDTASSTMAAGIITRTPILVSERHTKSYTYIKGPAAIYRRVSEGAVHALERLRRTGDPRSPPALLEKEWDAFELEIQRQNAEMWSRVLKTKADRLLWGHWGPSSE